LVKLVELIRYIKLVLIVRADLNLPGLVKQLWHVVIATDFIVILAQKSQNVSVVNFLICAQESLSLMSKRLPLFRIMFKW
jgi:hypothetical protein